MTANQTHVGAHHTVPLVAMAQASTMTKMLHKVPNAHPSISHYFVMNSTTYTQAQYNGDHKYTTIFECICYMLLPIKSVKSTVDQIQLQFLQNIMYSHDYKALENQYAQSTAASNNWNPIVNAIKCCCLIRPNMRVALSIHEMSQRGGGVKKVHVVEQWTWKQLQPHVYDTMITYQFGHLPEDNFVLISYCKMEEVGSFLKETANLIAARLPLTELLPLSKRHLMLIAKTHGIECTSKSAVDTIRTLIREHV